ncbi:hypothetical protein M569_00413 [Genlisea aurea]|uniref:glutathione transferase n=1 Tax=Genlisea aurea TaxID=192259 RepID=S8DA36_9LAMI|nr:hypothetical protein M569_00413 [Genlisea aurea]
MAGGGAVKVYGAAISVAVSRVLTCLIEKDVPFQLVPLNMAKGEHKKPDYLKIQPFGQVPAFQDENITLFESRAVLRYIAEKHAAKGNKKLFGSNPLEKASVDQWLEAEGQSFNPPSSVLVFQLAFAPKMKIKRDETSIKLNEAKLSKVLDVYDRRLGESRYLAGEDFSLADLSHLPAAQFLVNSDEMIKEAFSSRKNVDRWWEEISHRDSWKKVTEMH